LGDYVLKQQDLMAGGLADAVAIGGWAMDAHPPEGFDRPDLPPNTTLRPPEVYDIPLRSLYSRNIGNLLMAGRNISASYVAFTSARVMATCAVEGQAVGTAAAQCVACGILPRQLAADPKQVEQLQQTLLRDDQTIKGRSNRDPRDIARSAKVSASAEEGPAKASLVIDGSVRNVPDRHGDPVELHQWAAPLEEGKTAWIELAWDTPRRLQQVQITFDTGFKRQLTLSAQESQNRNLVRAPQPETVKDYTLIGRTADGETHVLATVKDNYQRLRRHNFVPLEVRSLRLEIHATHGDRLARVFEVRCYA
ncbi:MAG TPA: FAD-dependent oxidoreductase, partial [Bryobacteraceae bacterium]|nr:FAD-dependent oxidoreductase [Bryobacteraceae bacterium]